jgi:DUF1365 family protein
VSETRSGVYLGEVIHQRFAPRRHRLKYRVFQMLFDLDELAALSSRLRLFSHNRFNLFSFHDRDHGDDRESSLRLYVERILVGAGLDIAGGRISVLCMPRIFGYVFNPLSVYYCHGADGGLKAMIYEVTNTFKERHTYLIPVESPVSRIIRQSCEKDFYVSPFMDMQMSYHFTLSKPGETVTTAIDGRGPGGERLIYAAFAGVRRRFDDGALFKLLLAYPFLTLGVVAAIHWEASKLFAKGIGLRQRPAPPMEPVTIVKTAAPAAAA